MTLSIVSRDVPTPDQLDTVADVVRILHADPMPVAGSAGLTAEALLAWEEGHANRAPALLERAMACADRTAHGAGRAFPRLSLAAMLTGLGRMGEADHLLDDCRCLLADEPDGRWRPTPLIFRARTQLCGGRLEDAMASARTGIELAAQGTACGFLPIAWLTLAAAALDRDDLTGAAAAIAGIGVLPRPREPPLAGPPMPGCAAASWMRARALTRRSPCFERCMTTWTRTGACCSRSPPRPAGSCVWRCEMGTERVRSRSPPIPPAWLT